MLVLQLWVLTYILHQFYRHVNIYVSINTNKFLHMFLHYFYIRFSQEKSSNLNIEQGTLQIEPKCHFLKCGPNWGVAIHARHFLNFLDPFIDEILKCIQVRRIFDFWAHILDTGTASLLLTRANDMLNGWMRGEMNFRNVYVLLSRVKNWSNSSSRPNSNGTYRYFL